VPAEEIPMSGAEPWRRCSACKQPIGFGATYWICNVSTCNRERTALAFCSVTCWEVHLPGANHRESWALERTAPASAAAAAGAQPSQGARSTVRRVQGPAPSPTSQPPAEILIVASRLKDYIRARSGFNTSEGVLAPLSDRVRRICEEAIRNATREGRRTVLDRDIPEG
jgi:hypothetical protein